MAETFRVELPSRPVPNYVAVPADDNSDKHQKMVEGSVWRVRGVDWDVPSRKHVIVLERVDSAKS